MVVDLCGGKGIWRDDNGLVQLAVVMLNKFFLEYSNDDSKID